MMKIPDRGRGHVRCLGLAAAAILLLSTAASRRAEALSLINPGPVPTAKYASDGLTEIRGGHGGGHGGGGYHGGGGRGYRGGGAAFHSGGGYRAAHVFRGGGYRYGGHRYGGYRYGGHRFAHRHHFHRHFFHHRRFFYDDYPYYYRHRRCHTVWTYYGPRRVCHFRHWRHHYYW
jgi:hypothetical protein